MIRWLVCLALVACGKSKSPAPAAGSGAGSGSGVVAVAPADAAAPVNPLAEKARCSGHWTARLDFTGECEAGKLDAYRDVDVVVAATPAGWQVTVAKPAGMTIRESSVHWSSDDGGSCSVNVWLVNKPVNVTLELHRGGLLDLGAIGRVQLADNACMAEGNDHKFTFVPDNAPPPPIAPAVAALAGSYDLTLAWPKIKCSVVPDGKLAFDVSIDRTNDDALVVKGFAWDLAEARDNGDQQLYARLNKTLPDVDDHFAEVLLLADVKGDAVTGTAKFSTPPDGPDDDAKLCKSAEVTIVGTRRSPK